MSVLIEGMKMPECCYDCPLFGHDNGKCQFLHEKSYGLIGMHTRSSDCPLVELPTADEFAEDMRTAAKIKDEEASHSMMDDIMCGILCQIGYEEAVAIFDDTPKWYA